MDLMEIILAGFFVPAILFFIVGMLAVVFKSDLSIPPAMSKGLAIFLLMSIGLEGGVEAIEALGEEPELIGIIVVVMIISILLGIFFAFSTGNIMTKIVGVKTADGWASAGHYAAVSSATLALGVAIADAAQAAAPEAMVFAGWMPAMYPFMDSPAIITAILFGRMALAKEGLKGEAVNVKKLLHEGIFGMAVFLLVAALIVGALSQSFSPREMGRAMAFFDDMFRGVLAIFLLDMGLVAGKQLGALKELGSKLGIAVLVAFIVPQVWGIIGILGMYVIHTMSPGMVGWGDAFVFACIAGGASFISAPAAMRASIPEANPSFYLPMSVALTFPFNIIIGMPMWQMVTMALWGV